MVDPTSHPETTSSWKGGGGIHKENLIKRPQFKASLVTRMYLWKVPVKMWKNNFLLVSDENNYFFDYIFTMSIQFWSNVLFDAFDLKCGVIERELQGKPLVHKAFQSCTLCLLEYVLKSLTHIL